jgi:hypothetical protein
MRAMHWILVAAGILLAGCGDKNPEARQSAAGAKNGDMPDMQMGGHRGMGGMQMMPGMRAHMDSMSRTTPEQMRSMMAGHEEIASRMLDAMGADMRGMSMTPDAAWTALSDSVRSDLADLPRLSGGALKQRMQGHVGRLKRLMDRHEAMMGGMQPK